MTHKFSYCQGCGHTYITRICDELILKYNGVLVSTVGCSAPIADFTDCDVVATPHGRGLPIATGIRLTSNKKIIVYSGDGDALNIGIEHLCHATARNTDVVQIIVNNGSFAMTGFQMSAATPNGVKTKTGIRQEEIHGIPINPEFVTMLNPKVHFRRALVTNRKNIEEFKKILEEELEYKGFSVIEVFSPCPTFWGNVKESYKFAEEQYVEMKCEICKNKNVKVRVLHEGKVLRFCQDNMCIVDYFSQRLKNE